MQIQTGIYTGYVKHTSRYPVHTGTDKVHKRGVVGYGIGTLRRLQGQSKITKHGMY